MFKYVPRIDDALLNEMILKIEVNELALAHPGTTQESKAHPEMNAEDLDEKLFKALLFEQPISDAKCLIENMRHAFYSKRYSRHCCEGLKALPVEAK